MRPDKKPGFFRMLWELLYPFLVYQFISSVVTVAGGMLLFSLNMESFRNIKDANELIVALSEMIYSNYGVLAAASGLLTLPLLIYLYKNDRTKEKAAAFYEAWENVPFFHYIIVFIMGVSACIAVNHLLIFSRLTELLYDDYEQSAALLFQGKLIVEIIFAGILIPIVEELIFRGLAYRRMRWYLKPLPAMILSSLYFGAVHGNWLQGIYAFLIGMLLAFAYERFKNILAPILIHIGANTVSILISDAGIFDFIYEDDTVFYIVTGVFFVIFVVTFYLIATYVWPTKKPADDPSPADRLSLH